MRTTQKIIQKITEPFRQWSEQELFLKASEHTLARQPSDIIKYGYNFLDKKMVGIDIAELVVLGSATGGGKSTFMRGIARSGANQGYKVLYFILEDSPIRTEENEIYLAVNRFRKKQEKSLYSYEAFVEGTINKRELYEEMLELSKGINKNILENLTWATGTASTTGTELLEKIKEEKDTYDLFIVDHLHYIELEDKENKQLSVENFMKQLSKLVSENSLRVIMASHYKKLGKDKPNNEAFKDAQAIAQNATTTIHFYKNNEDIDIEPVATDDGLAIIDEEYNTEFYIEKTRNLFVGGKIEAKYNKQTGVYDGYSLLKERKNNKPNRLL